MELSWKPQELMLLDVARIKTIASLVLQEIVVNLYFSIVSAGVGVEIAATLFTSY